MPPDAVTVDQILDEVSDLYSQAKYLQAFEHGKPLGELKDWTGTRARMWAGRLAANLGAPRLGSVLQQLAWRADRTDLWTRLYYVTALLHRRDPLFALKRMEQLGEMPEASENLRADWFALRASMLALLRDFENADAWIQRALELTPERSSIWVESSNILAEQDQHEAALESAERAVELRPWYRPAVQAKVYALIHLSRDAEALGLLTQAAGRAESGGLLAQLAWLQTELRQYADARENYERIPDYFPLMEDATRQWLSARRSDAAYHCFDFEQSALLAAETVQLAEKHAIKSTYARKMVQFMRKMSERLSVEPLVGKRVMLDVGYVRQHYVTCAPATLTALSNYWKKPVEHDEVADEICYAGTQTHNERKWAEKNGWIVREFTVTWESAVALLDRGVPFTMAVTYTGMSHLQAVMGYDSRRKTLLIRDPTDREFLEYESDEFFRHEAANGPHGMALAPVEQAALLEDLELPEESFHDRLHELNCGLENHDRDAAQRMLDAMQATDPDHRLTLEARYALAIYDSDSVALLQTIMRLLEKFPDDENLQLTRLGCLQQLGRRDERLEILHKICDAKDIARGKDPDPMFYRQLAQELLVDARQQDHAEWLLRRTIRWRPGDADSYRLLASIRWNDRRRDEALELLRYAACLSETCHEEKQEWFSRNYFNASRHLMQTDVALRFLKDRFERFGHLSSFPAQTLIAVYDALHRHAEAEEVLQAALQLHPSDGDMRLFAAEYYTGYGEFSQAKEMLAEAKPNCHRTMWLRGAAEISACRGDLQAALAHWREILELEPLALEANDAVARLLFEIEGYDAAISHMRQALSNFPNHYALHQMLIGWLQYDDPAETEAAIRNLLAIQSVDPWGRRELADSLYEQGKLEEGLAEARTAYELEPSSAAVHLTLGLLHRKSGDVDQAKEYFRKAIRLSVDYGYAMEELLATCDSKSERATELEFVRNELLEQVILGDAVLIYRDCAATTLEADELLVTLHEIIEARPDLWQAWSARIDQLLAMHQVEEALETAKPFTDRFPLLPVVWLDLAKVRHELGDFDEEIAAIERALEIAPGLSNAARQLAEAYQHQGDYERAREVLEEAVARDPSNPSNRNDLAEVLWHLRRKDEALEQIQLSVRLAPAENDWAWQTYWSWRQEMGRVEEVLNLAREFTRTRPNVADVWLVLASLLEGCEDRPEAMAALNRALELDPRNVEAHGRRADVFVLAGEFDEAIAACHPPVFTDGPPLVLRARAAAIYAEKGDLPQAIQAMEHVVGADPEYFWAWAQLCQWYHETGREDGRADAAGHLVRLAMAQQDWQAWSATIHHLSDVGEFELALGLAKRGVERFPATASLWLSLGYVHHAHGDEPAEIAALERALQADPRSSEAARCLAETYTRCGEWSRCKEVLEQILTYDPDDAINHCYLAETLWNMGDRDAALEQIELAIRLAPGEEWGWDALRIWSVDAGRPQLPVEIARDLIRERPDDIDAWVAMASLLDSSEHRSEAHEALDRALQLDPRNISAHIQRAVLHAQAGDFDAAIVACHPPIFEERPPAALLLHAAEIEAHRGNLVAAIAQLQDVVLDQVDYFWAWKRLADWYEEAEDWENYSKAVQEMVRIEPTEPKCWGYSGDAKLRLDDRDGAKRDLRRAIEISPDYAFAANLLLELQIEDGELDAAEETIERVARYMPSAYSAAHRVRLASQRGDLAAANEHFTDLCLSDAGEPEPFFGAIAEMLEQGWSESVDEQLARHVFQPQANPQLGGIWIHWCVSNDQWDLCLDAMETFVEDEEIWRVACDSYLQELAEAGDDSRLQSFLGLHGDRVREDTRTWASAGASLAQLDKPKQTESWLADWRDRSEVRPYMLVALVGALWELGREDEAADVSKFAVELPHDDSAQAVHSLWLALHSAVRGDGRAAALWLGPITPEMFDSGFYAAICTLVQVLTSIENWPSEKAGELSYASAKGQLQAAIAPFRSQLAEAKLLRRIVYRCFGRIASRYGKTLTALWWRLRTAWA